MRVNVNHFPLALLVVIGGGPADNGLVLKRKKYAKPDKVLRQFGRKAIVESSQYPGYLYAVTQCDRWDYEETQSL